MSGANFKEKDRGSAAVEAPEVAAAPMTGAGAAKREAAAEKKKRGRRKGGQEAEREVKVEEGQKKRRRRSVPEVKPSERPVRVKRTSERYRTDSSPVTTITSKKLVIAKGPGTMLKDIPNVAFKLSRRKGDENLRSLHKILFGRKSNVLHLKRNISQFSGYVWEDNVEKERAKTKEKLDRCNKEKLLDFCNVLDIQCNKASTKKEELSTKVLEFLESPHVTREVLLSESVKKRSRSMGSKPQVVASTGKEAKRGRKIKSEANAKDDDEEDGEGDGAGSEETSKVVEDGLAEEKPNGAVKRGRKKEAEKTPTKRRKAEPVKANEASAKEVSTNKAVKRASRFAAEKSVQDEQDSKPTKPVNRASKAVAEKSKVEQDQKQSGANDAPRKRGRPVKPSTSNAAGKKSTRTDADGSQNNRPITIADDLSSKELKTAITEIVKEVDFDTATLGDVMQRLGVRFNNANLWPRRNEVRKILEEVIKNMSDDEDEAADNDENEDPDDREGQQDSG